MASLSALSFLVKFVFKTDLDASKSNRSSTVPLMFDVFDPLLFEMINKVRHAARAASNNMPWQVCAILPKAELDDCSHCWYRLRWFFLGKSNDALKTNESVIIDSKVLTIVSCLFGSTVKYNVESTLQHALLIVAAVHNRPSTSVAVKSCVDAEQNGNIPPMRDDEVDDGDEDDTIIM